MRDELRPHDGRTADQFQHPAPLAPTGTPPVPQPTVGGVAYHAGVPYYVPPSEPYVVVLGDQGQGTFSPWVRDLVVIAIVLLVVLVVCCACVIAVVVMAGGTLMGIIGAAASAAIPITAGVVGTLLALGWAATRIRALTTTSSTSRKGLLR